MTIQDPMLGAFAAGWELPDERPIQEWARDNIDFPAGGYAISGPFNPNKSRHLIPVFEALMDQSIRRISFDPDPDFAGVYIWRVNAVKATQTGGTVVSDVYVPWTVANAPGPILWSWHSDPLARQHAETRAMPVIKRCPALKNLLPDDPRKIRNKEIIFKNGVPLFIQGPSKGNLQSKSIRYLINDECWQWPPGRLKEAEARVSQYKKLGTSKELNISQGGTEGDDWHRICQAARQYIWEVACPHCGQYQALVMEEKIPGTNKKAYRMKWDEIPGGEDSDNGAFENERYICAHCNGEIRDSDATKAHFNESGKYRCLNPRNISGAVTFRWTSLIWRAWREVIKEYRGAIKAKRAGAIFPLVQFLQKEMALFWNPKEQAEIVSKPVHVATYDPREKWPAEKFRFLTVDCQANLATFYAVVRAWGAGGVSRRLWRGILNSFEEIRKVQDDWGIRSQFVALDSGYQASKIYRVCCRYVDDTGRGWVAMKGSGSESFTHTFPDRKPDRRIYSEKQYGDPMLGLKNEDVEKWLAGVSPHALALYKKGALKCPLYLWSNPSIKPITVSLRDGKGGEWLAPAADADTVLEEVYRQHMHGEELRLGRDKLGGEKWEWHEIGPNHFFDCENEQTVCATIAGCIPLPALA